MLKNRGASAGPAFRGLCLGLFLFVTFVMGASCVAAGEDEVQQTYERLSRRSATLAKVIRGIEGSMALLPQAIQKTGDAVALLTAAAGQVPATTEWNSLEQLALKSFDRPGIEAATKRIVASFAHLPDGEKPGKRAVEAVSAVGRELSEIDGPAAGFEKTARIGEGEVAARLEKDRPGLLASVGGGKEEKERFLLHVKARYLLAATEELLVKVKSLEARVSILDRVLREEVVSQQRELGKIEEQRDFLRRNYPVRDKGGL